MFEALWLAGFMLIWVSSRWIRQCFLCETKCNRLVRSLLLVDYAVLYLFFFIFFSANMVNIFSNLPSSDWLDPDTLDSQFRASYAVGRRLANGTTQATTTFPMIIEDGPGFIEVSTTLAAKPVLTTPMPSPISGASAQSSTGPSRSTTRSPFNPTRGTTFVPTWATTRGSSTTHQLRPIYVATTSVTNTAAPSTSMVVTSTAHANTTTPGVAADMREHLSESVVESVSLRPYPFVRWVSILAPLPVLATWVICGWDTWQHAQVIWQGSSGSTESHDLAIQIIALPMVYSLLSLSAMVRMWNIMSNFFGEPSDGETWATRRDHALEIYEADYQVADLYEAWALHHFAVLAMQVLRRSFNSGGFLLNSAASSLDTTSPVYQAWAGTLKGLHKSVRSLTMQGIWSFVICCACASIYGLTTPLLEEMLKSSFPKIVDAIDHSKVKMRFFFLGMGTVASTAAICNILQIERAFHYELLHFKPFLKFWGTKILVSIAFLQSILFMLPIPPFQYMSTVQANLTYSVLMCYECLLISLLHMYAWSADEDWYKEGCGEESAGLTAVESMGSLHELQNPSDAQATQYGLRSAADTDTTKADLEGPHLSC